MTNGDALILNHFEARGAGLVGRFLIDDAGLQPKRFRANGDGIVSDGGYCIGLAEDVYNVNLLRDIAQRSITFFAQDFRFIRVDRDDFIAFALEILPDAMTGAAWIARKANHCDGL